MISRSQDIFVASFVLSFVEFSIRAGFVDDKARDKAADKVGEERISSCHSSPLILPGNASLSDDADAKGISADGG